MGDNLHDDPIWDMENNNIDNDDDSSFDFDKEELEIALYSQIHFETNDTSDPLDGVQNDDLTENFLIDIKGNNKTGYQTSLTTSDYVTNEIINTLYGKNVDFVPVVEMSSVENTKPSPKPKLDNVGKTTAPQESNKRSAMYGINKNLAEKLILQTGSETEDSDDLSLPSGNSDNSDSTSDEDLVDLDIEDSEDDTGLFVNVSRNQRPLLEHAANDWDVDVNDLPDYTSRFNKSRYYKPIGVSCRNCDKIGHLSKNCPEPKKEQTCGFCSESGHSLRICPDAFCYNCEEPGHIAKECGQRKKNWLTPCSRCSVQGHKKSKCPDQWRQYHKTVDGKKLTRGKRKRSQRNTVKNYCYNCAGDDHFGHECEEQRMNAYSQPSYPFICNYIPVQYDSYSHIEREYPCNKNVELEVKSKTKKKKSANPKNNILHSFVNKDRFSGSTGRNNFDNFVFPPSAFGNSGNNFKFGFKSPDRKKFVTKEENFGHKSIDSGKKRKVGTENALSSKKQKMFDKSKKKDKKRGLEIDAKISPKKLKESDSAEGDSLGTISITVTNKDKSKFKEDFTKNRNITVVNKKSNEKTKHLDTRKSFKKANKTSKPDNFNDEIKVRVKNKEEDFPRGRVKNRVGDFPRGGLKKLDTYCDEISVSFVNNNFKPTYKDKNDRGFVKTRKFESLGHSEVYDDEDDHQVYQNEWWLTNNAKKNKKKEKKKKC